MTEVAAGDRLPRPSRSHETHGGSVEDVPEGEATSSSPRSGALAVVRRHPAATALSAYLVVALPVLVWLGRDRWFFYDEWDFLANRQAWNLDDLMRPHNEHWSTFPILIYRAIYALFGIRSYWPYQIPLIVAHLAVVGLLFLIMRRSHVNQWVAAVTAAMLVLFGPGYENILWAFQIGFTGALAFGLTQLLLADHDGGLDRRDWLALAAGLCALLFSGVGITTAVVVGVATLLRRGWRMAAFQTVPLAALYGVWYVVERPKTALGVFPISNSQLAHVVYDWVVRNAQRSFGALGHFPLVAALMGLVLVVGLVLAWATLSWTEFRLRGSKIVALLVGAVVFASITGVGRWFFGLGAAASSRYLYLTAAFVLPALGVAADALIRRWQLMAPALAVLVAVSVPGTIGGFGRQYPPKGFADAARANVLAIARSPLSRQVSPSVQPDVSNMPFLTVGWILGAQRDHKLPSGPPTGPLLASLVPVRLGVSQSRGPVPHTGTCSDLTTIDVRPAKGARYWVAGDPLYAGEIDVRSVGPTGRPSPLATTYNPSLGALLTIELPDLHLQVSRHAGSPAGITTAKSNGPVKLCH